MTLSDGRPQIAAVPVPMAVPENETESQRRKRLGQPHIRRECGCGSVRWYKSPSAKKLCKTCRDRQRKQLQRQPKKGVSRVGTEWDKVGGAS